MTAALSCFLLAAVLGLCFRGDRLRTLKRSVTEARHELSRQDGEVHLLKRQIRGLQLALGRARRETRTVEARAEKDNREWLQVSSHYMRQAIDLSVDNERLAIENEHLKLDGIEAQLRGLETGR